MVTTFYQATVYVTRRHITWVHVLLGAVEADILGAVVEPALGQALQVSGFLYTTFTIISFYITV